MELHKLKYLALCTSPSGWLLGRCPLKSRQADGDFDVLALPGSQALCLQPVLIGHSLLLLQQHSELEFWLIPQLLGIAQKKKKISLPFGNVTLMVLANKPQADEFRKTSHFLFCCSSESTQQCFICRKGYICGRADWRLGPVLTHLWHNQHRQRWVSRVWLLPLPLPLPLTRGIRATVCFLLQTLLLFLLKECFQPPPPLGGAHCLLMSRQVEILGELLVSTCAVSEDPLSFFSSSPFP